MMRMFLTLAFGIPSLIVIRAVMGGNLEWYETLSAGVVAAMFSSAWITSCEK